LVRVRAGEATSGGWGDRDHGPPIRPPRSARGERGAGSGGQWAPGDDGALGEEVRGVASEPDGDGGGAEDDVGGDDAKGAEADPEGREVTNVEHPHKRRLSAAACARPRQRSLRETALRGDGGSAVLGGVEATLG